jgi:hypothetical protein
MADSHHCFSVTHSFCRERGRLDDTDEIFVTLGHGK